ncbi:hypothetical protein MRBLMA1_002940 [Sphingobium sp. LMA1-1-1.1]|uniref:hypothetical protein n=1 Tax=Sphingobium sp. LMA1-1-1.1 TaxID=3135238 RepID=UPI0034157C80
MRRAPACWRGPWRGYSLVLISVGARTSRACASAAAISSSAAQFAGRRMAIIDMALTLPPFVPHQEPWPVVVRRTTGNGGSVAVRALDDRSVGAAVRPRSPRPIHREG